MTGFAASHYCDLAQGQSGGRHPFASSSWSAHVVIVVLLWPLTADEPWSARLALAVAMTRRFVPKIAPWRRPRRVAPNHITKSVTVPGRLAINRRKAPQRVSAGSLPKAVNGRGAPRQGCPKAVVGGPEPGP
jgi:hypothetical protein